MTVKELCDAAGLPCIVDENGVEQIGWTRWIADEVIYPPAVIIFNPDRQQDAQDERRDA